MAINGWYIRYSIYMYNGIVLSHKREQNCVICSNIGGGYHAKWNKSDRERQILYDITCMWSKK